MAAADLNRVRRLVTAVNRRAAVSQWLWLAVAWQYRRRICAAWRRRGGVFGRENGHRGASGVACWRLAAAQYYRYGWRGVAYVSCVAFWLATVSV